MNHMEYEDRSLADSLGRSFTVLTRDGAVVIMKASLILLFGMSDHF